MTETLGTHLINRPKSERRENYPLDRLLPGNTTAASKTDNPPGWLLAGRWRFALNQPNRVLNRNLASGPPEASAPLARLWDGS
jgi:hypothetical protein